MRPVLAGNLFFLPFPCVSLQSEGGVATITVYYTIFISLTRQGRMCSSAPATIHSFYTWGILTTTTYTVIFLTCLTLEKPTTTTYTVVLITWGVLTTTTEYWHSYIPHLRNTHHYYLFSYTPHLGNTYPLLLIIYTTHLGNTHHY